ncbi:MAG: SagB family peptide dehydrogenase [Chloroflexota bacterium]|nr:MAG: SagB family peptide dehydrogenase [Chloroflexota bacterium]
MTTRVTRHDLSYLISLGLLILATFVALTGLASDLWDLNDFVFHKYAGYVLALMALAHVYLHWGRLVSYIGWRLRGHPRRRRVSQVGAGQKAGQQRKAQMTRKEDQERESRAGARKLVSRRTVIALALGGVGGLALGRLLQSEPELPFGGDVGVIYHEWGKPKLRSLLGAVANWGQNPPLYKVYAEARRIDLPPPGEVQGLHTEDAIQRRRSVRNYSGQTMTLEELSRLLCCTSGITGGRFGRKLRAAPSAGALYPIEIYPVIHRIEDLEAGLYHYAVQEHALELLQTGDLQDDIVRYGLMQEFLGQANLVLVFTAILQRLRWKYQERSYRYALIEAGHLGQNAYLAATSMGLGACAVGAFLDDGLNAMLGVDGQDEAAIYMVAVGKR